MYPEAINNYEIMHFQAYDLTALDHLLMPAYVHLFLSFRTNDRDAGIGTLRKGIARLISELPFLTGTIVNSGSDPTRSNVLQVQPPSDSFLSGHPILQVRFHDGYVAQMASVEELHPSLIPVADTTPTLFPTPGLRFQANVMRDGIVLCVCWHHCFMDGAGIAATIETLARCCQDPDSTNIKLLPDASIQESARQRIESSATATGPPMDVRRVYGPFGYRYSAVQITRNVVLCPRRVERLTGMCNSIVSQAEDCVSKQFTHDDIVSAVLWVCVGRARILSSDTSPGPLQTSSLTRYVDVRRLFQPSLPMPYLGNAIAIARSHCISEDLGLGQQDVHMVDGRPEVCPEAVMRLQRLAWELHSATSSIDLEQVQGIITSVVRSADWGSHILRPADISISSLRKLPLYTLHFGHMLGKVQDVEVLESTKHGQCAIKPARGRGPLVPWEVRMALPRSVLQQMMQDNLLCWLTREDRPKI